MILSEDKTGRLMKYDSKTKQVQVVLENLSFPNGVALSKMGDFILIAETTHCRILRYWLNTSNEGTCETFAQLRDFQITFEGALEEDFGWESIRKDYGY